MADNSITGAVTAWQPIKTAPLDGTVILVANQKLFTRAYYTFHEERALTSLGVGDPETNIPAGGMVPGRVWSIKQVPNPKAGERKYYWSLDNPVAFKDADIEPADYDGNFEFGAITHWMPCPTPPGAAV